MAMSGIDTGARLKAMRASATGRPPPSTIFPEISGMLPLLHLPCHEIRVHDAVDARAGVRGRSAVGVDGDGVALVVDDAPDRRAALSAHRVHVVEHLLRIH